MDKLPLNVRSGDCLKCDKGIDKNINSGKNILAAEARSDSLPLKAMPNFKFDIL